MPRKSENDGVRRDRGGGEERREGEMVGVEEEEEKEREKEERYT